ncbi:MAG: cellulase family glycosylhydrolase, partial [Lachnospiraceae bacterium]|nr:cellulase family glycosylhydrolase [Lachnospiraceae bacterium]
PGTSADPSDPGTSAPSASAGPSDTMSPNVTEKPAITSTPDTASTPTPTQAPAAAKTPVPTDGFEMTSLEFATQLGAGINIGNSLDSNEVNKYVEENGSWNPYPLDDLYLSGAAGLNLETSWGNNSKISKEFLHGIKEAGFKTIRLPVTYINHVKTETVNGEKKYTIDADWLNRVQEIVDWALEEDLYIIINIHHDGSDNCDSNGNLNVYGGEQASWLSPLNSSTEAYEQMEAKFVSLWEQIAVKFKDYSDHLLFADMNEFHHGYNPPSDTWCNVQNKLHQAFVDTVRSTGDNNVKRHLIVPGYNTNIDQTISGLVVPTDISENQTEYQGNTVGHIMVEVHYYDPYTYAGDDPSDTLWGSDAGDGAASWGHEDYLENQMQKMNTNYVAKGIPVIIGEFGAPTHKIDEATDRIYRTYYYSCVVKSAVQNGIVPITWDNGTTYKLLNRDGTIAEQSIVDAIIKYTNTPSAEIVKPTTN